MIDILKSPTPSSNFLEAGEKYIASVVRQIEDFQIYPRHGLYRDVVLLALLDKVVTTGRAVLCLVRQGFPDEAFGLSRTCIEAFFSLRYIENKDSEERAKRYVEYFGKDREHLLKLIAKHHPHLSSQYSPDHDKLMKMAEDFKSPHTWFLNDQRLRDVVYEQSTWSLDDSGQLPVWEYTYDLVYKLTSHEVHATSVALASRIGDFFMNSNYPPVFKFSKSVSDSNGGNAVVNVCVHVQAAIEHVFHAFDMIVPHAVREQFVIWNRAAGLSEVST